MIKTVMTNLAMTGKGMTEQAMIMLDEIGRVMIMTGITARGMIEKATTEMALMPTATIGMGTRKMTRRKLLSRSRKRATLSIRKARLSHFSNLQKRR